jgi:hypothetical protein
VGPSVDSDLVTLSVSTLQSGGVTDSTGSDNEESGLLLMGQKVVVESRRVGRWTI